MRILQFLRDNEIPFETIHHPPTFMAERRAERLEIPGAILAKSVLVAVKHRYYLTVLPSTCRIVLDRLISKAAHPVRLADRQEIAEVFRDCEYGVLSPFGSQYGISTLVDEALAPDADMVFEAHFHSLSLRMKSRDYERLEQPHRFPFARQ